MGLCLNHAPHEIIVVDDGSSDRTAEIVNRLSQRIPEARLLAKGPPHGFGHALSAGLMPMTGDAAVVMMATSGRLSRRSPVLRKLDEGWDALLVSRLTRAEA